jgi:hypothetical protein
MKLSPDQLGKFWQLWPQACRANNWTREAGLSAAEIDSKRKEFLARCGFASLTTVDRTDGFTKVKNELLVLIGVSLKAGQEATDPTLNQARVLKHKILNELMPCLALYEDDVQGYLTSVMEDKNRWWKIDRPACDITLEDLDAKPIFRFKNGERQEFASTLEQLMMTINSRVNSKRKAAGQTIHEMKMAAGVDCECKACCLKAHPAPIPAGHDEAETTADLLNETHDQNPY